MSEAMSDTKWAPAPWFVAERPLNNGKALIERGTHENNFIATCEWQNASLIAAAPDLYEALANLVPRFERAVQRMGSDAEYIAVATAQHRAALAKARGEP